MSEQKPKAEAPDGSSRSPDEKRRTLPGIEPVETHHQLALPGRTLTYTARAGVLPLRDAYGDTEAEIFFTAYELEREGDSGDRPLTFAFNGGPGSSSVWLHMGALGPQRVAMEPEGWMPAPPYRCVPNEHTWLDRTDLVFIDPVGTGYSRAVSDDLDKKYCGFKGDLESVGEFIRLYLTRYRRWASPLYLTGESYGTTRAAGLAGDLVDQGITFNGIVLISTVLDFGAIRFMPSNDLPFQLFVPTYAATARYHGVLSGELQRRALDDLLSEVKPWAEQELTVALMQGDRLPENRRREVGERLAAYTGLDLDYVLGTNLRINILHFCKQLLRGRKRSIGRLDSRFQGIEAVTVTERPEFDPSMLAITPPYTSVFNDYVRSELGIETDLPYETLNCEVNKRWEWEKGSMPATGEALRAAIAKNPFTKVFVGQGTYDLATPSFATEYMLSHLNLDPEHRDNVEMHEYEAGHMFYLDEASLASFGVDIARFFERSR